MFIHLILMNKGDGARSRALGKGSWLVFASLKQRSSAVSQTRARQQTLTHITIDNIEKNKTKQNREKKSDVQQNENIMVILYNCQKLIN